MNSLHIYSFLQIGVLFLSTYPAQATRSVDGTYHLQYGSLPAFQAEKGSKLPGPDFLPSCKLVGSSSDCPEFFKVFLDKEYSHFLHENQTGETAHFVSQQLKLDGDTVEWKRRTYIQYQSEKDEASFKSIFHGQSFEAETNDVVPPVTKENLKIHVTYTHDEVENKDVERVLKCRTEKDCPQSLSDYPELKTRGVSQDPGFMVHVLKDVFKVASLEGETEIFEEKEDKGWVYRYVGLKGIIPGNWAVEEGLSALKNEKNASK